MKYPESSLSDAAMDTLMSGALAGSASAWPRGLSDEPVLARFMERICYHGIGALLTEQVGWPKSWPRELGAAIKREVLPQALWELRHSIVLSELIEALASKGILAIILKGTGLAYEYYSNPVLRSRGDTDLIVDLTDLPASRTALTALGYICDPSFQDVRDELKYQEVWSLYCTDETVHHIDLHWQVMNSPTLEKILTFADCKAHVSKLPRLSQHALTLNRVMMLVHTLLHRATHILSPYLVDYKPFYGGNRLIWASDISLLSNAMSVEEWRHFCRYCLDRGIATVCLDGLRFASQALPTPVPELVLAELEAAPHDEPASRYLLESGQFSRSIQDLSAINGWNAKARYAYARLLPSPYFMRGKYPDMNARPLITLYFRRLLELFQLRNRLDAG